MVFFYIFLGFIIGFYIGKKTIEKKYLPSNSIKTSSAQKMEDQELSDPWEGSFWEAQKPLSINASLRIKYRDSADKITERTVDVRQFDSDGSNGLLIGHCKLRNATRTFKMNRIVACVDAETGEIISNVFDFLNAKYSTSPEASRDRLREEEYDVLRILLYVSKADGQLRAAERVVMRDTCRKLSGDSRMTDKMIDDMFGYLEAPSIHAFKLAVGRVANKPSIVKAVIVNASQSIVETQKEIHPAEQEALDYLNRKLA